MPSLLKTAFLQLNKWAGNEYPKREDFVSDNEKIDAFADDISSQMAQIELDVTDLLENKSIHSSGSNANGRWIRFQDGTQVCSFTQRTTGLSVAANTNNSGSLSFPSPFLEQPMVTGNVWFTDSDGNALQSLLNLVSRPIEGSTSTYRFVCVHNGVNEFGSTGRTGTQRVIDMVAIGRWK